MRMIVTAFSDTHGLHRQLALPECDILIFAGDAMTCGYKENELIDFLDWFNEQPAQYKIMIAGNHDRYIENHRGLFQELLKERPSITYLEDSGTVINGLNIWGTPHSREFCNWAFNRTSEQMGKAFSHIPNDTDILVSHAPQYGILDKLERGEMVGEPTLSAKIKELEFLRYHIHGHIHSCYGLQNNPDYKSLNVSVVNEGYELQNEPISFKIYPHG